MEEAEARARKLSEQMAPSEGTMPTEGAKASDRSPTRSHEEPDAAADRN